MMCHMSVKEIIIKDKKIAEESNKFIKSKSLIKKLKFIHPYKSELKQLADMVKLKEKRVKAKKLQSLHQKCQFATILYLSLHCFPVLPFRRFAITVQCFVPH